MKINMFNTYAEALRAAANAVKDGYNAVIIECNRAGVKTYATEYFKKDSDREIRDI